MKKELNYLASKRWEKVGRQELRSTPYKQEINPKTPVQVSVTTLWSELIAEIMLQGRE
jgi:hypothetical protein